MYNVYFLCKTKTNMSENRKNSRDTRGLRFDVFTTVYVLAQNVT